MITIKRLWTFLILYIGFIILAATPLIGQQQGVDTAVPADLPATNGMNVSLYHPNQSQVTVLAFLGVECPLAKLYASRLARLSVEFENDSVRFIGINSNQQDSMDEWKAFVNEQKLPFECCKDYKNVVASHWNVERTPEVIVFDQQFNIQYRGRIDDQYSPGVSRNRPEREDLRIALAELTSNRPVTIAQTDPEGCLIGKIKNANSGSNVTYANQISSFLQRHCVECHRKGEIGPFALDDYDEVAGWAEMIVETIDNGRMPPWHADPKHGSFLNERLISDAEKALLRQWVADGAPQGNPAKLPPKKEYVTGWRLPKEPDLEIAMRNRPFVVPADGVIEYQYFVVDPKFTEDKWVSAAEVIPGNRSVVHHSIVFVRPPDGTRFQGVGWLGSYVPGQNSLQTKSDRARRIPAGSKLVFQQHYTPNGTATEDITKIGIVFAEPSDVKEELVTLMAIDQQFEIAPYESNHVVKSKLEWFPRNGQLLSVSPHMHFRGKSFSATVKSNDSLETLLSVPRYDFNWQHTYQFREPVELAKVDEITIEVAFDNSVENPLNPDPTQRVTWGDQTWEEMAIGFFDVSFPLGPAQESRNSSASTEPSVELDSELEIDPPRQQKIEQFVNSFFERFDSNHDDVVVFDELPISTANWALNRYDRDGITGLSRDEIKRQAMLRFR